MEDKKMKKKDIGNGKMEKRNIEMGSMEKRKIESRNIEKRNAESRNIENRNTEKRNMGKRNIESRNIENGNMEKRNIEKDIEKKSISGKTYAEWKNKGVKLSGMKYGENKETGKKEAVKKEAVKKGIARKGTEKRETEKVEVGKKEAAKNGIVKRESMKKESEKRVIEKRKEDMHHKDIFGKASDTRTASNREHFPKEKELKNRNHQRAVYESETRTDKKKKGQADGACPYRRDCGGCRIHEKSYQEHLKEKQKLVKELLVKYCPVESIVGMEEPSHYRNKVHVVFDRDRRGNAISGVYEEGTHRVVPIDSCLIHNQKADEIIVSIRGLLKSFKIKTYDEDTGYGLLRHVLIRTGYHSKEIMVVLIIGSPIFPSKNNFVKALRELHPEISTIVVNVNDKNTSMVLGDKEQVIYGKGYIEDTLCEKVFRISPKSFYQVNPIQTEKLYRLAIDMAGLTGKETVLDAYCGIGTIGLIASGKAEKVIGVELNKDAVSDARINAKRNNASNVQFYLKDAGEFMSQLAAQQENIDVVFMDPPRAGSDERFLDSLAILKPEKVVYISCNPVTLQRDVEYLTKKGYKAEKAIPLDLFPWTSHVEVIIMMTYCGQKEK